MNHYDTLEVSPRASQEVIRAAYRSLMQRFHPDRNPGDQAAALRAAAIVGAYEVLSDVEKRARYDADVQAASPTGMPWPPAQPPDPAGGARPARRVQPAAAGSRTGRVTGRRRFRLHVTLWLLAAFVAVGGLLLSPVMKTRTDPAAELDSIRLRMSSDATEEAEKRRLYARKLAILEEHPDLARLASAQRSGDMAARTFALLASPLVVRVSQPAGRPGPTLELTLPAVSLLLGTFDAANLLAHMGVHRERLVQELAAALAREAPETLSRPQAEATIKRVVATSVTASLAIPPSGDYPSTYFSSPGTYGVVAVLLPEGFGLVQVESYQ